MHSRLLIRPGAIGDCLLSLPVLEWLRTDYTEVWVPTAVTPLIRFADRACGIAGTGLNLLGVGNLPANPHLVDRLRRFDSIISWYGANREEFRASVSEVGLPFEFHAALPPQGANVHATDFFADQVGAPRGLVTRLNVPTERRRDCIVIQPFSGSKRKNWPLEKFQQLERELPYPADWLAGPEEPLENATHIDDLWELACWLSAARAYIGNDSGITHLAAATGIQTVALFGPTDPDVWAPRAPNVTVVRHQPLEDLSVDTVLQAVGAET